VLNALSKVMTFPDAPALEPSRIYQTASQFVYNGPRLMEHLHEMKETVLMRYDLFTIGETSCITPAQGLLYTAEKTGVINTVFHFDLMDIDSVVGSVYGRFEVHRWHLRDLKRIVTSWQLELELDKGWNTLFLENHDHPRAVSRFGDDSTPEMHNKSAKMLATWLMMLKGTPFIYQGQEIGTTNPSFESIDDYKDVETWNVYNDQKEHRDHDSLMKAIKFKSRDNARTPMQWSSEKNAGFSEAETTWLKVGPRYQEINVQQQLSDPHSILQYYKQLIKLRKEHCVAVYGVYQLILENHDEVFAFFRTLNQQQLFVIANCFGHSTSCTLPNHVIEDLKNFPEHKLLLSNYEDMQQHSTLSQLIDLRPFEARIYLFENNLS